MARVAEPGHIVYRRGLMNKLTGLLGQAVSQESHPDFYADWSVWERTVFNARLVAPETISPLIKALDAEHRETPWAVSSLWDAMIAFTNKEPEETGNLDWTRL